jgi:outer membrane protein TolC
MFGSPQSRIAWVACALLVMSVQAQTNTINIEWKVTADQLVCMALTNNLDIRISQIPPEIDQLNIAGLWGSYEPNFSINATHSYDSFPSGIFTQAGLPYPASVEHINSYSPGLSGSLPSGLTYFVSGPLSQQNVTGAPELYSSQPSITLDQPLLKNFWIDGTRYQILLNKNALRIDKLSLELQVISVINNVKGAYYNLIYDLENIKVEEAAVQLAEQTKEEDEQKVRVGTLAPLDEKQAESQAASAQSDLFTAQAALAVQQNAVKNLLGVQGSDWDRFVPVPTEQLIAVPEQPIVKDCWRQGLERRPDMLQAKANMERQHITVRYDFNQLFPELDLTGSYGRNATELTFNNTLNTIREGTYPFYSYGVALTIPIGNTGARSRYKADKASMRELVLQTKKVELSIITAIDDDIKNIQSDLLKVDSTRKARIFAEQALQAEQIKLEHGTSTSFVVLQLQSNLTTARSSEIRALADYNIAQEQLAFDEGTTLERNNIKLQIR